MNEQVKYYQERAKEYELVYYKQERQEDLKKIRDYLTGEFENKSILEIACGTGYWTEILAKKAKSIFATDINDTVIEIAKQKPYPNQNVTFEIKDYKELKDQKGVFQGLFGGFIWSHIPKEEIDEFLEVLVERVDEGSQILFIDNKYVEGSSTIISRTDKNGNTYQERFLQSGDRFEVVKNFPNQNELEQIIMEYGEKYEWIDFDYYWIMKFTKR